MIAYHKTLSNMQTLHSWTVLSFLKALSRVGFPQIATIVVPQTSLSSIWAPIYLYVGFIAILQVEL